MSTRIDTVRIGVTNVYVLRDRGTVLIDPAGPPGAGPCRPSCWTCSARPRGLISWS